MTSITVLGQLTCWSWLASDWWEFGATRFVSSRGTLKRKPIRRNGQLNRVLLSAYPRHWLTLAQLVGVMYLFIVGLPQ